MEPQGIENQNREDIFVTGRTFQTKANTLFNMWIVPEIYTSCMGPAGADMLFLNADIREGGAAHWQMTNSDQFTKFGKLHYKTINPNLDKPEKRLFVKKFVNNLYQSFQSSSISIKK